MTHAPDRKLATPTQRLLASAIDGTIVVTVGYLGAFFGAMLADIMASEDAMAAGFLMGWFFWFHAVWFLNMIVYQGLTGSSLGKKIFKIEVVTLSGEPFTLSGSMVRGVSFIVSTIPFYLGLAPILFQKKRQAFHDMIAKTVVVERASTAVVESTPSYSEEMKSAA